MININFKYYIILVILLYSSSYVFAQKSNIPIKFWGLQNLGGKIGVEGEYKFQNLERNLVYKDELQSSFVMGQFLLTSESYFYHPNLISLLTEMEYNPGTSKDNYLVIPDQAEVTTGEKVGATINFLRNQPYHLMTNASYSHIFSNRDFAKDLETYNTNFGGGIGYRNDIAPLSVSYQNSKIDQKELGTNRQFLTFRDNIRASTEISLSHYDNNNIVYNYDNYRRKYFSDEFIKSKISSINLNSSILFDSSYNNSLNSYLNYSLNTGDLSYNRFQATENIKIQLQSNFNYSGNYSYFNFGQNDIVTKQHTILNKLEHQLYKSLKTSIFYEYINTDQTFSEELIKTGGVGFNYSKKIPTGVLNISYDFRKREFENNNLSPSIIVVNEEHSLSDAEIVLLNNPYIDIASVKVKDETGTILFQEFLDYIIIKRADFIEIQRIPGGLISNTDPIYVDYSANNLPSYEYSLNTNIFSSRVNLFSNFLELYFRLNENSYDNIIGSDAAILKSISQRLFGVVLSYSFISAGIELDDYNSNIIPYESTRYFFTLNTRLTNKLNASFTGNMKKINLLDEMEEQEFRDLSARFVYNISSKTRLNIESSYRFQRGKGLDLNLTILRSELRTRFRAIDLIFGIEGYNRNYIGEKLNYWGSFLRIERIF